jgi:hypothetical protein
MTNQPARDGSPGFLRSLPAGLPPIAVSVCPAAAWFVSARVIPPAVVAIGVLASIAVAFVCAGLRIVELWFRVRSRCRRRRAVDRLIEHLAAELQASECSKQRGRQHLTELRALFNIAC